MDTLLFNTFYQFAHRSSFIDSVINFFATDLGYLLILLLLTRAFFSVNRRSDLKWIFTAGLSGLSAWGVATIVKLLISAPRPFLVLSDVAPLFPKDNDSFPSGHAAFFGGLAFSLVLSKAPGAPWYALGALLIGLARIAAGVHWPADIITGFLIGFVLAYIMNFISSRFFKARGNFDIENSMKIEN